MAFVESQRNQHHVQKFMCKPMHKLLCNLWFTWKFCLESEGWGWRVLEFSEMEGSIQNEGGGGGGVAGLSMNILHASDNSPMQRGFFTNGAGDLLPTLVFLGKLYICNFVLIFSLI